MRLKVDPLTIGLIVAIILGVAVAGHGGGGFILQKHTIFQAESAYSAALTVADKYIDACIGDKATGLRPVLPATCVPTAQKVQNGVRSADAAYQVVVTYETMPPQNAVDALWAAAQVVLSVTPLIQ